MVNTSNFSVSTVNWLVIQPTPFCNLDCDYCYLPNRSSRKVLELNVLYHLFKKLGKNDLLSDRLTVLWHAGEPLSLPTSFYENAHQLISSLCYKYHRSSIGISYALQTNATLINQTWCEFFLKHDVFVGVSLDGPAIIHNTHRKTRTGLGSHAGAMHGISLLQRNKVPFEVITVLTEASLDYPDEIFHFFIRNNIYRVGFNVEEIEGNNKKSSLNIKEHEYRYRKFISRFYELVVQSNISLKVREFEYTAFNILKAGRKISDQVVPFRILCVDCDGNLTTFSPELMGCKSQEYDDFILGNIIDENLISILEGRKFRLINQDVQAGVEMCRKSCEYFNVCGGGSPSNKYFENGTFRSTETMYCKYIKKIITDTILSEIEENLKI